MNILSGNTKGPKAMRDRDVNRLIDDGELIAAQEGTVAKRGPNKKKAA